MRLANSICNHGPFEAAAFRAQIICAVGCCTLVRPESFCVRTGNRLYYQSISDAPGVLPPNSASTVYFGITGTPDGGRNELSLKNEFSVLVTRLSPVPPPVAVTNAPAIPVKPLRTPRNQP